MGIGEAKRTRDASLLIAKAVLEISWVPASELTAAKAADPLVNHPRPDGDVRAFAFLTQELAKD